MGSNERDPDPGGSVQSCCDLIPHPGVRTEHCDRRVGRQPGLVRDEPSRRRWVRTRPPRPWPTTTHLTRALLAAARLLALQACPGAPDAGLGDEQKNVALVRDVDASIDCVIYWPPLYAPVETPAKMERGVQHIVKASPTARTNPTTTCSATRDMRWFREGRHGSILEQGKSAIPLGLRRERCPCIKYGLSPNKTALIASDCDESGAHASTVRSDRIRLGHLQVDLLRHALGRQAVRRRLLARRRVLDPQGRRRLSHGGSGNTQ